ncbi:MarR family winged helix-turn-helix transcriptional regulator [Actinomadura madurae]|uniref:MarR family winged helix-turn-helix transcriptional regulator n=1 Tax=Actinomadura madurae TaxID=1993 RepID=UPI0020262119|nr:MarR family transcriptional regulator [Actinomadura madurae]MCP9950162.1 MarR family transcriptional regulator [Actinomadura madurae]MCP9966926.1 MarR family transcriptional regulator [Actinomadura madurae]MCP9979407.1 MarR family transcriptional regulator [Actinomadura madurae]MCQ0009073.1 MarR family transcriptional regulator [Actinomadura madurae]URM95722.1 MarR family transcriptional regulator [Actinomadura madurae]
MSTAEGASAAYRRYLSAVMLHGHASARACDLGGTDLYALNILDLAGAMTPGELSARTGLTTGPTTRLIDRLEQGGYVRRVPSPEDRRKVIVEPVAAPADLDRVMAPARKRIGEIIGGYTDEQREVLFDYFARAETAFREAADELRN